MVDPRPSPSPTSTSTPSPVPQPVKHQHPGESRDLGLARKTGLCRIELL